jgi:hypothetical protein
VANFEKASPWKARVLALYLPQYYPTPENDTWWGPGFTEWTNVAQARPLFHGHRQPQLPGELGFYDLRLPETRAAQAALAREHGVEGFIYWHYWFDGRRLLDRPFREVLTSGAPDFPFCLGWANHSWTGVWIGAEDRTLVEQTYPGERDIEAHFQTLLPAFLDPRYIRVDGAALLYLFRPRDVPDPKRYWDTWRKLASRHGVGDLHVVGVAAPSEDASALGLDAIVSNWVPERARWPRWRSAMARLLPPLRSGLLRPTVYSYEWYTERSLSTTVGWRNGTWEYSCVVPNWDNTPRSGTRGVVLQHSTPERFGEHVRRVVEFMEEREIPPEHRVVILKSWNEWAEGNYMEPDRRFGRGYLEALRDALRKE